MSGKITNTHSSVLVQTLNWVVDAAIEGGKEDTIYETSPVEPANLDFICEDTISELSLQCLSTGGITNALNLACTCKKLNEYIIPCLQKLKDDALLAMWKGDRMMRQTVWPEHLGIEEEEAIHAFYKNKDAVDKACTRIINAKVEDVKVRLRNPFDAEGFSNMMSCLNVVSFEMKIIPLEITLMDLVHINLTKNQIRFIPEFFCNFKRLRSLNLANNQISNIPACIIDKVCDGLRLQLEGNPLLFIPEKHRKEGLCPNTCRQAGLFSPDTRLGIQHYMLCLWFSQFNNYDDSSKFSKFIKLCLQNIVYKEKIKSEFELFEESTQKNIINLIVVEELSQWPLKEMLTILDGLTIDNIDLFCKALRNVLDKV